MTTSTGPIVELDATFFDNPYATYARLHEHGTVHRVRFSDGFEGYVITGWEQGRAALAHPRLYKAAAGIEEILGDNSARATAIGQALTSSMLNSDPPDHTRLRGLVNKAFTPRAIASLQPRIEEITTELLDALEGHEQVDLIEQFAVLLPITVICELLGVPLDDRDDFRAWSATLLSMTGAQERAHAASSMVAYLSNLIAAKREGRADDMLTALVHAVDGGHSLTETELISTAFLLLVAGHETTVNLIGNGMLALLRNRDQLAALQADPSLIPGAVEEFLRFDGPVDMATIRYTREPVTIDGVEIPSGEFVYVALASANRDPEKFPDPDRLDVTRRAGGHVAFGYGIHYCVGAPLARMEAVAAFTGLLRRFPELTLIESDLAYRESYLIRGLLNLPVAPGPAAR